MSEHLRIARVRISNVLGITHLEFDAKTFNEIAGPNGQGKTSVLNAIKSVFAGGEDATLLRRGEKEGEVVLVIDDGTEMRRRVTENGTATTVKKNGVRVNRPAESIKALTDAIAINPIDILRARPQERVNIMLDSLPMTADPARLSEIVGHDVPVQLGLHALTVIEKVRTSVYDERTGTNRAVKEKESTINQLAAALPEGDVSIPAGEDGLVAALKEIDEAKDAEMARIEVKLGGMRADSQAKIDGLRAKKDAEIEGLRRSIEATIKAYDKQITEERETFSETERRAGKQREMKTAEFGAQRETVSNQLATIQAAERQAAAHAATRATVAKMRVEADHLQADADRQTAALAALDAYKSELLDNLPVPGLEVRGGAIFRHGIPFDRLNSAQQVEIAVEIAKLRSGKLGVICVDGIELLDGQHYATFKEQAIASGLQLFVTRVSDDEFHISTEA